jgi:hypothetical protein
MVESPWLKIQTAKTLAGCAERSEAEAANFLRRMVFTLCDFWSVLPTEFFTPWDLDGSKIDRLDLTSYLPPQPAGRSISYIRLPGFSGIAILSSVGIVATVPNPTADPILADLEYFNAGLQAQHLSPRLLAIEAETKSMEVP